MARKMDPGIEIYHGKDAPQKTHSWFQSTVRDADGIIKAESNFRLNLTTDTAVGATNRRDWQSKALGDVSATTNGTGTLTSVTATSATNTGAAFSTAGQGLAGRIVAVGANSAGVGTTVFGVIVSNSGTVLTIDQWYSATTMAVGTTPNGTGQYQILPGQFPAPYLAVTENAAAPTSADTTLTSELAVDGFARALGTYAHTAAATTYTLSKLFTASGTRTINKEAVFGAANVTAGGVMPFESAEPNPPTLVSGDTLTQTVTITIN